MQHVDRAVVNIVGYQGSPGVAARSPHAYAGQQDYSGKGIQHGVFARCIGLIPIGIFFGVIGHTPPQLLYDRSRVFRVVNLQPQGFTLGMNQVVGSGRPDAA